MRKSLREKLADAKRQSINNQVMTPEQMFALLLDDHGRDANERKANPTQILFYNSDEIYKGYMGPKGCSKTSTLVGTGLMRSIYAPGSKGFIGRNDYNDVMITTGKRAEEMLARLPKGMLLDRSKNPPMQWWIQPIPTLSPEGDIIDDTPSEITFVGMESLEAGGSFEVNWGIIDEAHEVKEENVRVTSGWLRYRGGNYFVGLAWNPTDTFHWLYRACTGKDHQGRSVGNPWITLFLPNPRENQRNLPDAYYETQAQTMTEDQKIRLIEGKWGATFEGAPVAPEFKYDLEGKPWHARSGLMQRYDKYAPLFRYWDFGYRHPFCCWTFFDWLGRHITVHEQMGTDIEIGPFIEQCRAKEKQWFPDHKGGYIDWGDPAARQKKDTGSTLAVMIQNGITLQYQIKTIDEGLQAVRVNFGKMVEGEPLMQIDKDLCPILCNTWRGGYHRDDTGHKPVKDGFYDHPADTYRYGVTGTLGVIDGKVLMKDMPKTLEYNRQNDPTFNRR